MTASPTDCAYMAGLVDGEGHLSLRIQRRGSFDLSIWISMTDLATLEWVQDRFGGTISPKARARPHHKPVWRWYIHGHKMCAVLRAIQPYLVTKAIHAEVLMEAGSLLLSPRRGGLPVPENNLARRRALQARMTDLNFRGLKSA